jgi:hypothetical protein
MFLGNLLRSDHTAMALGLVFAALAVPRLLVDEPGQVGLFHMLVVLVLFTAVGSALSRSHVGVSQALSSRYSIYSILMACALYGLYMNRLPVYGRTRLCLAALAVAVPMFFLFYLYPL